MLIATRPNPLSPKGARLLTDHLRASSHMHPDREAIIDGRTRITWAELERAAHAAASGLRRLGVAKGDIVLVQLPNRWETVVTMWATWLTGAVVAPVVPIYRAHELEYIIGRIRPAAAVTMRTYRGYEHSREIAALLAAAGLDAPVITVGDEEMIDTVDAGVPFERLAGNTESDVAVDFEPTAPASEDIVLVLFTSGTTAAPKGVLHSHATLVAEADSITKHCQLSAQDAVFMPSPLSHITGLSYGVILPAVLGSQAVLLDRWVPQRAVELVEDEGCTFCVSSTPFLRGLTEAYASSSHPRSSLRLFVCGGADIPPALVLQARQSLGTRVLRTYGSTEAPTVAMVSLDAPDEEAADNEGPTLPGDQMRIALSDEDAGAFGGDTSELQVRGPELFVGYLQEQHNRDAFTPDGWFRTGDCATIDAQARLRITGRLKDIINRAGEKYSATEVEWVLLELPSVAEVAVVGIPDDEVGERACAFIVPSGAARPDVRELAEHIVGAGLAIQKAPEHVRFVDELPRTQSGKIQKYRLKESFR